MNAGPDVERVIADWLTEEAPPRAPDRILRSAASTIEHTRQRRFAVDWREPMTLSPARLVAALAIVAVVAVGAGWLGRSNGVGTPVATPSPTPTIATPTSPTPTASAATLESYRAARDAICTPAVTQVIALNAQLDVLKPAESADDLATSITLLEQIIAIETDATDQLATLTPPPALAADHAADVAHHRDSLTGMAGTVAKLRAGQLAEAGAIGDALDPVIHLEESYEQANGLAGCP